MRILIFFFVFANFFCLNANAETINCISKKFGVVEYDGVDSGVNNNNTLFKIKIDKEMGKVFFEEVLEDGKTSPDSLLFTEQYWNITSTSADTDIRAYGSVLGEFFYATNIKILNISFPLGDGSVGVTISDCY